MTQEEKQLLLKDLCARLPYHPIVKIYNDSWEGCMIGEFDNYLYYHHVEAFLCDRIEIKPYLRPISNMTEEERNSVPVWNWIVGNRDEENALAYFDFLLAHHFDFLGLIKKGLALEASEDIYKTK